MADTPTPSSSPSPTAEPVTPDHEILTSLVQKLRGAGVVDNQVTREVHLSEADAKELAETLEQMATRLSGPQQSRSGRPGAQEPKP